MQESSVGGAESYSEGVEGNCAAWAVSQRNAHAAATPGNCITAATRAPAVGVACQAAAQLAPAASAPPAR